MLRYFVAFFELLFFKHYFTLFQFQFDTNAGFVAAVNEMLVHSHVPGHFSLLPALPPQLSAFGRVKRLNCRGGVTVSFVWSKGSISEAVVILNHPHPWLFRVEEDVNHPGYPNIPDSYLDHGDKLRSSAADLFSLRKGDKHYEAEIFLNSPNQLAIVNSASDVTSRISCAQSSGSSVLRANSDRQTLSIQVSAFPCTITLRPPLL